MESPVLGAITPMHLSSGCKALIIMYNEPNSNVYATRCGDNCAKYIVELSKQRDVYITLHHPMLFRMDFHGVIMETGQEFTTYKGYGMAYFHYKYDVRNGDLSG